MILFPVALASPAAPVEDGWYLVATRGSHRQYKHRSKSGRVTIAGSPAHDLPPAR